MYNVSELCNYCEHNENSMISCNKISKKKNYACILHEPLIQNDNAVFLTQLTIYVSVEIRMMLGEIDQIIGQAHRAMHVKKIFDFLFKYPIYLIHHSVFLNAVYNKLDDFDKENAIIMGDFIIPAYKKKLDELVGKQKNINKKTDEQLGNIYISGSNYVIEL